MDPISYSNPKKEGIKLSALKIDSKKELPWFDNKITKKY